MKAIASTAAAVSLALTSFVAGAADFKPAVAYDVTGKYDKSFNQAVFENGVTKFNNDNTTKIREFEPANDAQREQGLERL
ncbi:MAG: hypothetical protein KAG66_22955, partial [Methylococcales bacterium]|nr:hypothetical protein [Methylococcales bacterium]